MSLVPPQKPQDHEKCTAPEGENFTSEEEDSAANGGNPSPNGFSPLPEWENVLDECPDGLWPPSIDLHYDALVGSPLGDELDIPYSEEATREDTPSSNLLADTEASALQLLQKYWGYPSFRLKQAEIIESVLNGRDTLGLLPTGGGKSITFQVPALKLPGLTLVVSPLIALMKDQVDSLRQRGIKATAVHSGLSQRDVSATLDNALYGKYKLLYISPERISTDVFEEFLYAAKVSLIVVDESHCISQWGYDFRPSYLQIHTLRKVHPQVPVLALTATATPQVVTDIMEQLHFSAPNVIGTSFHRSNLSYIVRRAPHKAEMMLHILSKVPGTAMVYCRNRKKTKELAQILHNAGIAADYFHAGLTYAERELRQNRWMNNDTRVMVATNAFGMGIDKPDVRTVIHWSMPNSLEEYFQEAGRAGRDGQKSYAVALVDKSDAPTLKKRIADTFPPKEFIRDLYDLLCSHLRIGIGEGQDRSFDFDPHTFIMRYKLHPTRTMSAINILELSGVWELQTSETRSRVIMEVSREQLYYQEKLPYHAEVVIQALLRSYGGIFSEYCFVEEMHLAALTGLSPQTVYETLVTLSKQFVLHYIPRKNTPRLIMRTRRTEGRHIIIPREVYEERMQATSQRINATIAYIQNKRHCRSQMLLAYFGEEEPKECEICDVCLQRHRPKHTVTTQDLVHLQQLLQTHPWEQTPQLMVAEIANKLQLSLATTRLAIDAYVTQDHHFLFDGIAVRIRKL